MLQAITNTFTAIAAMTTWIEDGPTSQRPKTAAFLNGLDEAETQQLVQGLIGLCGELLVSRALETGAPMQTQLQHIAATLADMASFLDQNPENA